jgi:hypothetical protein
MAACATKWSCDGFGSCIPDANGIYASQSDCKCVSCANNACTNVAKYGTNGTFKSMAECIADPTAQCGWNYKCASVADGGAADTFTLKVPSNMGTYASPAVAKCVSAIGAAGPGCTCGYDATVTGDAKFNSISQCAADSTAMCGWKYNCGTAFTVPGVVGGTSLSPVAYNASSPSIQLRYLIAQGANTALMGKVTTDGVVFDTGYGTTNGATKFKYYPVSIFTAVAPFVTLFSGGGNMRIAFGSGDDRGEAEMVLIPWGNYDGISPDPPAVPGNVQRSVGGVTFTMAKRTDVVAYAGAPQYVNGRGTTNWSAGFNGQKYAVQPGWQYAIAVQGVVATDDYVYFSFQSGPSGKNAATFTAS